MSSESFNVAMGLAVGYECGFEFVVVDAVEHRAEIGGDTEEAKTPGKRADRVFGVGERVEHGTAREEGERDQAEEDSQRETRGEMGACRGERYSPAQDVRP